jgi:MFS family permease
MKLTIGIGLGMSLVSFIFLLFAKDLWMLYIFAVTFGIGGWSVGAVLSPLIAELYGLKSHGVILGAITFAGTAGGAIGPLLAGGIFDIMKTYDAAFIICAVLLAAGLILLMFLRPTAEGGRQ